MNKTRTAATLPATVTATQFQQALGDYATNRAALLHLSSELDLAIAQARSSYDSRIAQLQEDADAAFTTIQSYCMAHRKTLFATARHMDTPLCRLGFRWGNPKLKTLSRITWEEVLQRVEEMLPAYVRTRREVDKEALLAARADPAVQPLLAQVGVMVAQDETFYIDLAH
jgi:phage host-nuclease inhibitor protein Gam